MLEKIIFLIASGIILFGATMVVTRRNLFHAALYLILALFGVAAIFVLLEAGFLAMVQLLIYVGGIAILIIFAIMLTRRVMDPDQPQANTQWAASVILAGVLFLLLLLVLWPKPIDFPDVTVGNLSTEDLTLGGVWDQEEPVGGVGDEPIDQLGQALVSAEGYVVPFEVASILLLVAMVGAIYVARDPRGEEGAE